VLPGGGQVSGNTAALTTMKGAIASIEDEAASQTAVGQMTDLYDAVRRTADFMIANPPAFGAPGSRVMLLFTDGLQTIAHGGNLTMAGYQAESGQTFANLLNARGIKLIAWGVGSDALGVALDELKNQAVQGGTNPVSSSKVLFPYGAQPNCTTTIINAAFAIVDNNGILPLAPVGRPPSGLLWEQFSLPAPAPQGPGILLAAVLPALVDYADFSVAVDGSMNELILAVVPHAPARPRIDATSPSGAAFTDGTPGTRSIAEPHAHILKISAPEEGTWRVRVSLDDKGRPLVLDLMARGVFPEFSFEAVCDPHQIPAPGKTKLIAWPRLDGKVVKGGELRVAALVLGGGGGPTALDLVKAGPGAGSFTGPVEVLRHGVTPVRVEVSGKLPDGKTINRVEFATVQVGPAADPRFTVTPDTYEQGGAYTVAVRLYDASFNRSSQINFGAGVRVTRFDVLNDSAAQVQIQVDADAFVGTRTPVTFNPEAEILGVVNIVPGRGPGGPVGGRICCLKFDAWGRLVGVVLCDGREICARHGDERLQKLLEAARDRNLAVKVHLDREGCLAGIDICRS
jgi:hypothetical protein